MSPILILTRPRADSEKLAANLEAAGYKTIIDPCLEIKPVASAAAELELALKERSQGIVITSRHAALALARMLHIRDLPIYAVGEATGIEALRLGFSKVHIAPGTAFRLSEYIAQHTKPEKGALIYAAGRDVAVDLGQLLAEHGFETHKIVVYKARASESLCKETVDALSTDLAKAVVFYSRRSAEIFMQLSRKQNLPTGAASTVALCLSANVAAPLIGWEKIRIAETPTASAMVALIKKNLPNTPRQ